MEAAAEARPTDPSDFRTGGVASITFGHATHDTYSAFLPPLLPAFIESLSLTKTEAGLLTVFLQLPSLAQPMVGHLADRISLHYFVILAPALAAVTMSLLGVMPTYGAMAVLLLLAGINSAILHSVGPVMAGHLSGRNLGRGMGIWMVGGELGRTLGPIVIVTAVQFLTLEGTPWLMLGGLAASALLFVQLRDVPGRPPNAGSGLPWRQALGSMGPFLVPLVIIILVRSFMISALTTYLPTFLTEEGAKLWFAGVSLSVLEAAGVVGALLGGSFSDRLGRRTILLVSLLTTPVFMVAFLLVDGWVRFPLLLLLGLSSLSITPVIMALVQETFPQNRALANGVYMSLSFLIRSGAVIVLGALGDLFGMRLAFTVSAVMPLLGIPALALFPARRR
jgi:MFS transporter, FSR family, fosmidomycin resistance protein